MDDVEIARNYQRTIHKLSAENAALRKQRDELIAEAADEYKRAEYWRAECAAAEAKASASLPSLNGN
jgi:hypothetical protein